MVTLREINEENFYPVISLAVAPGQERFVLSAVKSIAQCYAYRNIWHLEPRAIYDGETPVGFMLFHVHLDTRSVLIWRLLIDQHHQGKGYGTQAINRAIEEIKESGRFDQVEIEYLPANVGAERLYLRLGFEHTGEMYDGGILLRMKL